MKKLKFNPPTGLRQQRLVDAAMKHTKRDLAIMYVNMKWCFDNLVKKFSSHDKQ